MSVHQLITPGYKLLVSIVQAQGLAHLNHFTGDHPYCVCEVKHLDKHAKTTQVQTKQVIVGDTTNPMWNETHELEPWYQGEALEFTILDKGLLGSKTEGKASLPAQDFYPNGFNGMLPISGIPHALLQVDVQVLGVAHGGQIVRMTSGQSPSTYTVPASGSINYSTSPVSYTSTSMVGLAQTYSAAPTTYSAQPVTYSAASPATYTPSSIGAQTYVVAPAAYPVIGAQTYAASPTAYSVPMTGTQTPTMYSSPVATYPAAAPQMAYTTATPTSMTYSTPQSQPYMLVGTGAYKLAVSIIQAYGLNHMNHFTGDHPYCVCEVKHSDKHAKTTKVETKPVTTGDTLNPIWNETHELEPWHQGEPLEFTVYDKGLISSKTEGKVVLPPTFFPNGFSGTLQFSGLPHALLSISVRVLGPSTATTSDTTTATAHGATTAALATVADVSTASKKKKKVKVSSTKKSGCC